MYIDLTNEEIRLLEKSLISTLNKSKKSARIRSEKGYSTYNVNNANETRKKLLQKLTDIVPLDREYDA